ncbi:MAG TPA: FtsX-like permease family protein, partial [Gemmatimonadaceae bacterium]|nr:FtsX-like permease family protein [Gemmatimonadaceae bacterium]
PDLDVTVVARTTGDVAGFTTILRAAVAELDRSAPVSDVRTMSDIVSASLARSRFTVVLLTAFALVALVLAAVGIYGVVSFVVLQRTRELGVRMALGATPRNVLRLVLGRGAALAATGVAIGVAAAIVLTRLLAGLLYGVSATDALTFVVAPMLLFGVTMAATWIPARRAVQGDPLIALRGE